MKLVTDFRILMQKAHTLGKTKRSGDKAAIEAAQADHDSYRDLCLKAEKMNLGVTHGEL
ncbi:MAG: hypothetical protein ACXWT0_01890 [Methylobacter sp.]